jgi:hypothetical protein
MHFLTGETRENPGRLRHRIGVHAGCSDGAAPQRAFLARKRPPRPRRIELTPGVAARQGLDPFGNVWTRFLAPVGRLEIRSNFLIEDSGLRDEVAPAVQDLPDDVLPFVYGSTYCDTQKLLDVAWSQFRPIVADGRACRLFAITCITAVRLKDRSIGCIVG